MPTQPITSDENDPNADWTNQKGVIMPSPYPSTYLNSAVSAQMPDPTEMAKIGVDVGNDTKMRAFYRLVARSD